MSQLITILAGLGKLWIKRPISKIIKFSLILITAQIIIIIFSFSQLPPQIPLYFSRPWGEPQLAPTLHLFILPAISLFCLLINSLLAVPFLEKKAFLSTCLSWASLIVGAFAFITLIEIIFVTT